jgi:hypothetical protein
MKYNQEGKGRHNMKQHFGYGGPGPKRFLARLMIEKKKTAVALCLITVMALMWARVLGKRAAQAAQTPLMQADGETAQPVANPEHRISLTELPKVKGRHDKLTRDFFQSNGWRNFGKAGQGHGSGIKEVSVESKDGSEEVVRRIAGRLNLQAILSAENPQVFINNKLLSVGDKLVVKEGVDTFECEVVEIHEHEVSMRFQEARITLKLARADEVSE